MVSLLAVSLGLTATCLLIIRVSVQQEIRKGLSSDLDHSLSTFRNIAQQRDQMLVREASLMADLPSLKALMASQDSRTIQDGGEEFWQTSGSDFFGLAAPSGALFTYSSREHGLNDPLVRRGVQACMARPEEPCMVAFGQSLYTLSIQPLYFGPPSNGSQLGYVILGYAIDQQVAREVSDVAAAEVAFVVDGDVAATTLPQDRRSALRSLIPTFTAAAPQRISLQREIYIAQSSTLPAACNVKAELVVLKSYDRASQYLRRVNQWILILGLSTLLIGLALAAAISRTVTRPLEALVAGARALGRGDFNYQLNTEGAVEVRELGLAFERMRDEVKRTQRELLESDRLATIGRMASSVSHDLRHHLSAIYANAEFMSLANTGADERVELLLEVKEAVRDMTDLIESLLLFGRTGQILHIQQESLAGLVDRTVHSVRQHPDARDVQVIARDLQSVEANVDGTKISRALYNLVLNACQSARSRSGPASVTLTLIEDHERIRIAIADTGPGVAPTIRSTLFQPFVSSGKVSGVGLGLTVAQHVAQEHGGEVKLEHSEPGNTIFSILLYKNALQSLARNAADANPSADAAMSDFNVEVEQEHR